MHVKGLTIGEGTPKICVPMVGTTERQLEEEAQHLCSLHFDMVEWRVDFFGESIDLEHIITMLKKIRRILEDRPILFTFRTKKEGGEKEISSSQYFFMYQEVVKSRLVEFIDLELFQNGEGMKETIDLAHQYGVLVVLSNHDFEKTPSKEEIISRLRQAQELGGDIPKVAVMPNDPSDVLRLLDATYEMKRDYADRPIITMSMGGEGTVSRLAGEIFGSAITFGAASKTSAPGQLNVSELRQVLSLIHKNI
nr:type I 3-dehydroquinate dehydratase [Bacillus alkalicola]